MKTHTVVKKSTEAIRDTVNEAVKTYGTLYVLQLLIDATTVQAARLDARRDVVGANDLHKRNEILRRAYKDWHS